jgi:hypothetical protein
MLLMGSVAVLISNSKDGAAVVLVSVGSKYVRFVAITFTGGGSTRF